MLSSRKINPETNSNLSYEYVSQCAAFFSSTSVPVDPSSTLIHLTSSTWVSRDLRLSSHGAVDEWVVTLINSSVCVIIMMRAKVLLIIKGSSPLENLPIQKLLSDLWSCVSSKLKYRTLSSLFYSFTEVVSLLLLTFNEREPTISQHFHFGPAFIFLPQKG